MALTVGFVGLGRMGSGMCRNIASRSGADVLAFDLDRTLVSAVGDSGAVGAASVAELAERADVIFTSLPTPAAMEAVVLGPGGIKEHARAGATYFDLTTNSLRLVRLAGAELAEAGIAMLDAPVSGGPSGAAAGTLSTMVSGSARSTTSTSSC
jgi:3-hydroxyisobutyrate dehydrogenase and related beta-hydroxyacid dehydrogenases